MDQSPQTEGRLANVGRPRSASAPLPPLTRSANDVAQTTPGQTETGGGFTRRAVGALRTGAGHAADTAYSTGIERILSGSNLYDAAGDAIKAVVAQGGGALLGAAGGIAGGLAGGPPGAMVGTALGTFAGEKGGEALFGKAKKTVGDVAKSRVKSKVTAADLRAAAKANYLESSADTPATLHHATLIDSGLAANPRPINPSPLGGGVVQQPYMSSTFAGNNAWFDDLAPAGVPITIKGGRRLLAPEIKRPRGAGRWTVDPNSGMPYAGIGRTRVPSISHARSMAQAVV
jgi:hypothetical protein